MNSIPNQIKDSFAFKRLFAKTQVITNPIDKTVKNRGTHSLEVAKISKKIAFSLGLDPYLAEAIGLAHDLGHTPFGHLGERALDLSFGGKFTHAKFGSFLVQKIENFHFPLEIIKGIENHSSSYSELDSNKDNTEEGNIIRYADKIALIFSDYEDIFEKEKLFSKSAFPEVHKSINFFGENKTTRRSRVVSAFFKESKSRGKVIFTDSEEAIAFQNLKREMYKIYRIFDDKKQRENLMEISQIAIDKIKSSLYSNFVSAKILFAVLTDEEVFAIARNKVFLSETCIGQIFPIEKIKKRKFLVFS